MIFIDSVPTEPVPLLLGSTKTAGGGKFWGTESGDWRLWADIGEPPNQGNY